MKKFYLSAIFILILLAGFFTFAQAQEFDFQKAYNDYLFNYDQYRQSYNEYVVAKESFLTYQTLTSKNSALEKTAKMLKNEEEVIRTYLTALRMKIKEMAGISNDEKNILYLKLDNEIDWYSKDQANLSSAATLEDLTDSAKKMADKYQSTEVLIYQTLGAILSGKENNLKDQLSNKIRQLKEKTGEIRQRGEKDTSLIERWLLEAENRLTRSQEKQFTAQQILAKMKEQDTDKSQTYNKAQFALEESHQYLKEANSYLKEVIREIKSAN
jgi:hypothetical protein